MGSRTDGSRIGLILGTLLLLGAGECPVCWAAESVADWPTYGGNARRSGVTEGRLTLPLVPSWVYRTPAPRPAWPAPARSDLFHQKHDLSPSVTFDRVSHVAVADGAVYFGSSADDKLTCLQAQTGKLRWSFFTEGPVRLAPTVAGKRVYVGSDDGRVYCLAADRGQLLWTYCPGGHDSRIPGNGRLISRWPVRGGLVVDAGTVYVAAGLFPSYGVYLCAVDALDGAERWKRKLQGISPQGHILASESRLYVPSGRNSPAMFDRRDGAALGSFADRGGSYALLTDDALVYREEREDRLGVSDRSTRQRVVTFSGSHLVVHRQRAYVHSTDQLAAVDYPKYLEQARLRNRAMAEKKQLQKQKKPTVEVDRRLEVIGRAMDACWGWKQPCDCPCALILAGDTLFAGGQQKVAAFSTADGKLLWEGAVSGKAYGLAAAEGRLFVSTDRGCIHCFAQEKK